MAECNSAIAAFGPSSGSNHKLPTALWPAGEPPVLPFPFRNVSKTIEERLSWLLNNLTLDEKIGLLGSRTVAIPRLAIKSYMTYVECNSGAYANGHYPERTSESCSLLNLTVFPQSPSMAASFNTTLERLKGEVIGTELRAIALAYLDNFNVGPGLSCYAPMINVRVCTAHE